jgi:chromate transporter
MKPSSELHKTQTGSFLEVFITFLKLGLTSFGGPVAHLSYFRKELIEKRKWISEEQFSQVLAICQFLPGPASSQMGFALGLLRAGWLGALSAFVAFTLPSALLLIGFAALLPYLSNPVGSAAIHGLKIVAFAVVADAVLGMSKKLTPDTQRKSIAVISTCFIFSIDSSWAQIIVLGCAALAGLWLSPKNTPATTLNIPVHYSAKTATVLATVFVLLLTLFSFHLELNPLFKLTEAFYNAGAWVFGGGHVVLPLLEDSLVASELVSKENFLAGYGASQAIPGPMFAFAAYLGALIPTQYPSWVGAISALLFMFIPGFLLISAALPLWQGIAKHPKASQAIAGINAAVVGILGAALYDPIFTSSIQSNVDIAIGIMAFALLSFWKKSPLVVVLWCVSSSVLIRVF